MRKSQWLEWGIPTLFALIFGLVAIGVFGYQDALTNSIVKKVKTETVRQAVPPADDPNFVEGVDWISKGDYKIPTFANGGLKSRVKSKRMPYIVIQRQDIIKNDIQNFPLTYIEQKTYIDDIGLPVIPSEDKGVAFFNPTPYNPIIQFPIFTPNRPNVPAVPEPSIWVQIVLGLGIVGYILRNIRRGKQLA